MWLRSLDDKESSIAISVPTATALVKLGFEEWRDLDSAAKDVIAKKMTAAEGNALIDSAIAEVDTKLH